MPVRLLLTIFFVLCTTSLTALAECEALPDIYDGTEQYPLALRSALVIGVGSLRDQRGSGFINLKNPVNDARTISCLLEKAHFAVTNLNERYPTGEDLTRQTIKKELYDWAQRLRARGGVGLIYFSGHGVERSGKIYLVPADAYIKFERDLEEELIPLSLFYDAFVFAGNPLNFIVLDACRDNPWKDQLQQFGNLRNDSDVWQRPDNVMVANSTVSGAKAFDGVGKISPYAKAFIGTLKKIDTGLSQFFEIIADEFQKIHAQNPEVQLPEEPQRFGREFVFSPTLITYNQEKEIFDKGDKNGSRGLLEEHARKFPGGYFYTAALDRLKKSDLAPRLASAELARQVVVLRDTAKLRDSPTLNGKVLETHPAGKLFKLAGEPVTEGGKKWVMIRNEQPASGKVGYVNFDNVRPLAQKTEIISLAFEKTTRPGIDALTGESQEKIKAILEPEKRSLVSSIRVVGYNPEDKATSAEQSLRLLARQAAVIEALSQAGLAAAKTDLSTEVAESSDKIGSVALEVTEVNPSPGTPG